MNIKFPFFIALFRYRSILENEDLYNVGRAKTNKEHIIPRSVLKELNMSQNDYQFIYRANAKINNWRSNNTFSELDKNISEKFRTDESILRVSGKFQPPTRARGVISRVCTYFLYKYPQSQDTFKKIIDVKTLLKWNYEYPVTIDEYHRNAAISNTEGHRNIFVDHQNYVDAFILNKFKIRSNTSCESNQKNLLHELSLFWE
jgi:endonuclease I